MHPPAMTASKPSEPPASPLSKFNPGWVGAVVLGVSGVVALSGGWLAIERHGSDIKFGFLKPRRLLC